MPLRSQRLKRSVERGSAVVIESGRAALIERRQGIREGLYYVYPGGGIEQGETVEEAIVREAFEETGLHVRVDRPIAVVTFRGVRQHYYLVSVEGGQFGSGTGPEMTGLYDKSCGTYRPIWMEIGMLLSNPVYPRCVSQIVVSAQDQGWPAEPLHCSDTG